MSLFHSIPKLGFGLKLSTPWPQLLLYWACGFLDRNPWEERLYLVSLISHLDTWTWLFQYHLGSPSIPTKAHHSETLSAPNKKFRWKIFEQKLDLSPRQDPSSWWRNQRVEAMRTEKRRSRWLWERHIFWGEGGGMSTGSKRWTTKPKQIKDPKLPIWSIHKEHCQERTQQGEEEWKIVTLLRSQQQG